MSTNERLDEELFCLSNWLSLTLYEQKARNVVIQDFQEVVSPLKQAGTISVIGSFEYELYLSFYLILCRSHPNSNINVLFHIHNQHEFKQQISNIIQLYNNCSLFYNIQFEEKEQVLELHCVHSVSFPRYPNHSLENWN